MGFPPTHPVARRRAAEALLRDTDLSMAEIAARIGIPYNTIRCWNGRMAVPARGRGRTPVPDLAALRTALRGHVARQIEALDARLNSRDDAADPGQALRDLVGLKRLLDALVADAARDAGRNLARAQGRAAGSDFDGDADGGSRPDLAALRADLARRYAAFEAAGERGAVPGEPEPGPSGDAEP